MTYLIFSDTHGGGRGMCRIIEQNRQEIDGVLFLGDGLSDNERARELFPDVNFIVVAGNCDISAKWLGDDWQEKLIEVEGKRVLMMHGHSHGVKYGMEEAAAYARRMGADVLLFGHTHEAMEQYLPATIMTRELYLFNPGSASLPRGGEPSFGRLTVKNGCVLLSHGTINGGAR